MRKQFPIILLAFCLGISTFIYAQTTESPHGVAVRSIFHNYQYPLESVSSLNANDFTVGMEMEYYRALSDYFDLSFPLRINKALLPLSEVRGDTRQVGMLSLDALLNFNIIRQGWFQPHLFGGVSGQLEDFDDFTLAIPVGLGLNFRVGDGVYLSVTGGYRIGTDDFRDHLHVGTGFRINLGEGGEPEEPEVTDRDGDGIDDESDLCPDQPGPLALMGCPDADGDGVPDVHDKCPDVVGIASMGGCPDTDGDGIIDSEDKCPDESGPRSNEGCPITDQDGDGVPDAEDKCPTQAGTSATEGCPDSDGDGLADKDDACPTEVGTLANEGCPDSDSDGLIDKQDKCPNQAGPASNQGCPEVTETDRTTLTEAISAVKFETGSNRLTTDSYVVLDKIVDIMNRYPAYKLRISGHTDSVGSREPNQVLSERRAQACLDYLVSKGVRVDRMSSIGYGESQPIANNLYKEGREKNRRVEFDLYIE